MSAAPAAQVTATTSTAPAVYTLLAAASLVAAVLTGRVAMVAFAGPMAAAVVVGLLRRVPAPPVGRVSVSDTTALEGGSVTVAVHLEGSDAIERLDVAVDADGALGGPVPARAVSLRPGVVQDVALPLSCPRWGVGRVSSVLLRWSDPAGFVTHVSRLDVDAVVRVLPDSPAIRTLVATEATQLAAGNVVARDLGEGLELGEIRPYVPGDRMRSINWRVSARSQGMWVTDRHVERNVDVILAIDALVPAAMVRGVRAAQALADVYLAERDRVGVIGIGGTLQWLRPGSGVLQRHRITEHLIRAQSYAVAAWGTGLTVPMSALPPGALVIGLTSLLDDRSAGLLVGLRNRGFSVVLVEVDVLTSGAASRDAALGDRLHALVRDARRDLLLAQGVPLARWREDEPLEPVLAELAAYLRLRRRAMT